jgi:hypothetical protein
LDLLCKSYLNLEWKKRKNQPFAYTENKISIALFERWKNIKNYKSLNSKINDFNSISNLQDISFNENINFTN